MKKALYPGSFDPITNGHIDIVKRARRIFDEVYIAVFDNPSKEPLFSFSERKQQIKESLSDVDGIVVESFNGLLANYASKKGLNIIIRGLRAVSDFDYEFQMALTNRKMDENIDTVCLMTDAKYSYLSSSLVKQLAMFDGNIEDFVPKNIEIALKDKTKGIKPIL